jgi:hypothetical protein
MRDFSSPSFKGGQLGVAQDARVIDQDVNPAPSLVHFSYGALDGLRIGDIYFLEPYLPLR